MRTVPAMVGLVGTLLCVLPTSAVVADTPDLFGQAVAHLANREVGGDAEIEKAAALLEDALQRATSQAERDRAGLVLGLCYRWLGQPDKAVAVLQEVATSSPDLVVDLPEAKIREVRSAGEIGRAYRDKGDWGNALVWWETHLAKRPQARAIIANAVQARRLLGAAGQAPSSAMVLAGGGYLPSTFETGVVLAPVGKLAQALRLSYSRADPIGAVTLTRGDRALTLRAGDLSATATVASAPQVAVPLPAAPQEKAGDLLVPLRAVAEYFGFSVRWDPAIKLAQVH